MPSAIDLIGHNPALQEHWIRRFFAALIDAIVVAVIYLLFALPLAFVSLAWYVTPFLYGIVWLLYSMLLETLFGATIGKRLLSLRVVAIDGNLDIMHCLVRNISKIYWLLFLVDLIVGGVTQGDPRQRLFDRIARTTVTRVDQGAYMEEQFRMMQHAGPYPRTMPQAPPRTNPPPAPERDVIRQPPSIRARRRNAVKTIAPTTGRRSSTECAAGRRIPIMPSVNRVVTTLAPIPSPRTRSV